MADLSDLEDRLAAQAQALAWDMREDVPAAHRTVAALDRLELEQVCCVLAAALPIDIPFHRLAWWRLGPPPEPPIVQPCGTLAAYRRHTDRGEEPCEPCVEAARADWAERKRAQRRAS